MPDRDDYLPLVPLINAFAWLVDDPGEFRQAIERLRGITPEARRALSPDFPPLQLVNRVYEVSASEFGRWTHEHFQRRPETAT